MGLQDPWPTAPLHIDVVGRLHNRGQQTTTVVDVLDAKAGGQALAALSGLLGFGKDVTLDLDGKRHKVSFLLHPPDGRELAAKSGDRLTFKLRLTRGGLRAPRVKMTLK